MGWFPYDRDLGHERVKWHKKPIDICRNNRVIGLVLTRLINIVNDGGKG